MAKNSITIMQNISLCLDVESCVCIIETNKPCIESDRNLFYDMKAPPPRPQPETLFIFAENSICACHDNKK